MNRLHIEHAILTQKQLMSRNAKQPICRNVAGLQDKHCLKENHQWKDSSRKSSIHGNMKAINKKSVEGKN